MNLNKVFRMNWVAGCIGVAAVFAAAESVRFGLGELRDPGPGLFPFIAGAMLLILSVTVLVKEFPCAENVKGLFSKQRIIIGIVLVSPVLIFEHLGFSITIFIELVALLRMFGFRSWPAVGGIALLTTVISYFLFYSLLGMVLPRGPWGF